MEAAIQTTYGQLPALLLTAPDGAQACVTLYGAHLISWRGADGRERLFCSAQSALDGSRAIRGGVPVIFPQFAERGSGMRHGFARVSNWRVADTGVENGWAFAALAHQGDVYPASFAAVPHVVEALAASPETASAVYFHFPAWVEICRHRNALAVPANLETAYHEALARLPALVAEVAEKEWDAAFSACALSATAAAKGQYQLAQALLELASPEAVGEFMNWMDVR